MSTDLYFNLVWDDYPRAEMVLEEPQGVKVGTVKWRGQPVTINLIDSSKTKPTIDKKKENPPVLLYSLLKSSLQKQIRRGRLTAIATANRMWGLGQFELFRRLIVIAAEDTELVSETAVISWLMAAKSKGYQLDDRHRRWVLGYVSELLAQPVCRRLEIKPERDTLNKNLKVLDILNGKHPEKTILASILFRTAYGGLPGDPDMISQCLDWYLSRNEPLPKLKVSEYKEPLPKLLVSPAAIDHHIWNDLTTQIVAQYPEYDETFICTVIWECSSSKNVRYSRKTMVEWQECWDKIKDLYRELTREYLAKILDRYPEL